MENTSIAGKGTQCKGGEDPVAPLNVSESRENELSRSNGRKPETFSTLKVSRAGINLRTPRKSVN